MLVRDGKERAVFQDELFRQPAIWPFGEISDLHLGVPRLIVFSSGIRLKCENLDVM
jgi:hypothetical protein